MSLFFFSCVKPSEKITGEGKQIKDLIKIIQAKHFFIYICHRLLM